MKQAVLSHATEARQNYKGLTTNAQKYSRSSFIMDQILQFGGGLRPPDPLEALTALP